MYLCRGFDIHCGAIVLDVMGQNICGVALVLFWHSWAELRYMLKIIT